MANAVSVILSLNPKLNIDWPVKAIGGPTYYKEERGMDKRKVEHKVTHPYA